MYCKNCGRKISDEVKFCEYCGCVTECFSSNKKSKKRRKCIVIISIIAVISIIGSAIFIWDRYMLGGAYSKEAVIEKQFYAILNQDSKSYCRMLIPQKYETDYYSFMTHEWGIRKEDDISSLEIMFNNFQEGFEIPLKGTEIKNVKILETYKTTEENIDETYLEGSYIEYFLEIGIIEELYVVYCTVSVKTPNGEDGIIAQDYWPVYKIGEKWYSEIYV